MNLKTEHEVILESLAQLHAKVEALGQGRVKAGVACWQSWTPSPRASTAAITRMSRGPSPRSATYGTAPVAPNADECNDPNCNECGWTATPAPVAPAPVEGRRCDRPWHEIDDIDATCDKCNRVACFERLDGNLSCAIHAQQLGVFEPAPPANAPGLPDGSVDMDDVEARRLARSASLSTTMSPREYACQCPSELADHTEACTTQTQAIEGYLKYIYVALPPVEAAPPMCKCGHMVACHDMDGCYIPLQRHGVCQCNISATVLIDELAKGTR